MMTLKDLKFYFYQQLSEIYDAEELQVFFFWILETQNHMKKIDFVLNSHITISEDEVKIWQDFILELQKMVPIQYLLGTTHFYGLDFKVDASTLIPRPETEELLDWMLADIPKNQHLTTCIRILDIGTGSGCIPITLAHHLPKAKVASMDVSETALNMARQNAISNQVQVDFILQDVLSVDQLPSTFDIIVSNPPYVRNSEKGEMKPNVLDHEPHLALFVSNEDPLVFYRKIAQLAQKSLNPGGLLYFEINQYLAQETLDLLKSLEFQNIELKHDFRGNPRMIRAERG